MATKGGCRYCEAFSSLYDKDEVVEYKEDGLFIGGIKPTEIQLNELASEIIIFEQSLLWKLLSETIKAQAIDSGIRKAKDYDQLLFSKASLHVVEVQQSIINAIRLERKKRTADTKALEGKK